MPGEGGRGRDGGGASGGAVGDSVLLPWKRRLLCVYGWLRPRQRRSTTARPNTSRWPDNCARLKKGIARCGHWRAGERASVHWRFSAFSDDFIRFRSVYCIQPSNRKKTTELAVSEWRVILYWPPQRSRRRTHKVLPYFTGTVIFPVKNTKGCVLGWNADSYIFNIIIIIIIIINFFNKTISPLIVKEGEEVRNLFSIFDPSLLWDARISKLRNWNLES